MPAEICLRVYEELNDYLPPDKRKRDFTFPIEDATSVREVIRALGIPDSEVELILVNGSSAVLSHILVPGDRVSIYPVFESLDVKSLLRIRETPLRRMRFVAEPGLGRLASSLRSLGFDTRVDSRTRTAKKEQRILLTTDPSLTSGLSRIYVVRKVTPEEQLAEVLSRFDLIDSVHSGRLDPGESR